MRSAARVQPYEPAAAVIAPQIAEGVHVHRFDPACPIDVRFLVFGKRHDIRLTRHDYFEMLFVDAGEVVYQVQDREFRLKAGDLFVIGSTLMHGMSGFPKGRVKGTVLYFLPEVIRAECSPAEAAQYLQPFLVQDAGFPHIVEAGTGIPARIHELMLWAAAELPASSERARVVLKTCLKMGLVLLFKHYAEFGGDERAFAQRQRDLERLRPVFAHIDRNYGSAITVEDAASLLNLSKSRFMRFFKQVTGQSFVCYLNRFRVARAEVLLSTTDKSIAEVGQEVGFCDQSYFGFIFRTLLGVTPREYRRNARRT